MVDVNQRVRFVPFWDESLNYTPKERQKHMVTGTVVFVNHRTKMFTAEYNGFRESFKFCDIGEKVKVV